MHTQLEEFVLLILLIRPATPLMQDVGDCLPQTSLFDNGDFFVHIDGIVPVS